MTATPLHKDETFTAIPPLAAQIAAAKAMAGTLRERAAVSEGARCVPADSVADFKAAGLVRMTQPTRYGGNGAGWDTLCEVAQILAAADGAQGWVQTIMADHAVMLGTFSAQAQDDVWGADIDAALSASFEPKGVAVPVAGGFRFSGQFGFASGIDYADWLICGGFIVEGDKRDGPHFFLVPIAEAEIIDDWQTVGLEATGSKSFILRDAFVPEHRFLDGPSARAGTGPGAEVNPEPVYRMPRGDLSPMAFAALSVGMVQGLLDEWLRYTAGRTSRGVSMSDNPASHIVAGECSAEIDAAEALYLNSIRDAMRRLGEGETLAPGYLLRAKRDAAYAARTALMAGTRLFNAAGGRAIFESSPLQRHYRDLMAASSHFSVSWEGAALAVGRNLIETAAPDA